MTMRYFTPERWVRLQNIDDERAFLAAFEDWERALASYHKELTQALPRLPNRLRRFVKAGSLHDAILLGSWKGRTRLHLLVQPEPPADRLVLLTYTLVEPPRAALSGLPLEYRTEYAQWMYDEIGIEHGKQAGRTTEPVFTHSILLSNGFQISLRFRQFNFSRQESLLPLPVLPSEQPIPGLSQTA